MFENLEIDWEAEARSLSHAQTTKAHIGKMLDDGCTHVMAIAYDVNTRAKKKHVIIVASDGNYIDSNGYNWDAAYPINIYGEPLSIYEYEQNKYHTLINNGLKHSGDIT